MLGYNHASLQPHNAFGIAARARVLVPVDSVQAVQHALQRADWAANGWFVLGGGSNLVLTGDVPATVLKVEIGGLRVVDDTSRHVVVEAGAGVGWHELVQWTLAQGLGGLKIWP